MGWLTALPLSVALLVPSVTATAPAGGAEPAPPDYATAYRIGLQAYVFGLPLLTTDQTFRTMTSTDAAQGVFGPVNQFHSNRGVNSSSSTTVVAPGATGLSSIAWLDLTAGPQVLHVPAVTGHAFVLAFVDPYTTNIVNLGSASRTVPGDYVIRGPSQRHLPVPPGTHVIDVDYSRIWIIGSTQLKGPKDIPAVNAIQDGYRLTSLYAFVTGETVLAPVPSHPTITPYALPTGLDFFDSLGDQLRQFPPPARDSAALAAFASVGIGPGLHPSKDAALGAEALAGLAAAAAAGPQQVRTETERIFASGFVRHDGYLLGGFGRYGTDYDLRAVISQVGLGAFVSPQAMYALTWTDRDRRPLDGSQRYVIHLAQPPPTREGWSLTVYSLAGALMPNPIGRSAFTSTSMLTLNRDGSVDIYVQAKEPSDPARRRNWLPVEAGQGFELTWRMFAPQPAAIPSILDGSGWRPPAVSLVVSALP